MESASVQKAFVFDANMAYQNRGAFYHYRDDMMYLFFNLGIFAGLPDGRGVSGKVGAGVCGTVIAAIGPPKTFRSRGVVTMLE